MKKIISVLSAVTALASCGVEDIYYGETYDRDEALSAPYEIDWQEAADSTVNVLVDRFMNKDKGTFYFISDNVDPSK